MPRWLRTIRGMLGTGLTFSAGAGVIASVVAGIGWLIPGGLEFVEMARLVAGSALWAFPIGVVFSGGLALTARTGSFESLSLPRFAALGAAGGLLVFGLLATNAWQAWSVSDAIANAVILVLLGTGAATGSLLLARRAAPSLEAADEVGSIGDGTE